MSEALEADANLAEIRRLRAELAQAQERAQRAEAERDSVCRRVAEFAGQLDAWGYSDAAREMRDEILIGPVNAPDYFAAQAELTKTTQALRRAEADNAALVQAAQPLAERFAAQPWETLDADARRLLTVCRAQPYPGADLLTTLALIRGTLRDDPAGAERVLAMILDGSQR